MSALGRSSACRLRTASAAYPGSTTPRSPSPLRAVEELPSQRLHAIRCSASGGGIGPGLSQRAALSVPRVQKSASEQDLTVTAFCDAATRSPSPLAHLRHHPHALPNCLLPASLTCHRSSEQAARRPYREEGSDLKGRCAAPQPHGSPSRAEDADPVGCSSRLGRISGARPPCWLRRRQVRRHRVRSEVVHRSDSPYPSPRRGRRSGPMLRPCARLGLGWQGPPSPS